MIRSTIDMDFTVEQMMKDGFTIKMANFYHELMKKNAIQVCGLMNLLTGLIITAFWLRVQFAYKPYGRKQR